MRRNRRFNAIESTAAAWLVRRDGGFTDAEKSEFDAWRDMDVRHAAALDEISAMWRALDDASQGEKHAALRRHLGNLARRDRRRRTVVLPLAAAAALVVAILPFFRSKAPLSAPSIAATASATRVLTPERRLLADGSTVEFRPGAAIEVAFTSSERRVSLTDGEAHFQVAHDAARPFIVMAGTVGVRAVGTAFSVDKSRGQVGVIVTEGTVRIGAGTDLSATAPQALALTAGQRIAVSPTAGPGPSTTLTAEELAERLSWRVPRLDFADATIATAAKLFNAHSALKLRVVDEGIAEQRITGVFRVDNVEGFVRALEVGLDIGVEHRADEILLRSGK